MRLDVSADKPIPSRSRPGAFSGQNRGVMQRPKRNPEIGEYLPAPATVSAGRKGFSVSCSRCDHTETHPRLSVATQRLELHQGMADHARTWRPLSAYDRSASNGAAQRQADEHADADVALVHAIRQAPPAQAAAAQRALTAGFTPAGASAIRASAAALETTLTEHQRRKMKAARERLSE